MSTSTLKIANWNIEWMNRWFSADTEAPRLRDGMEGLACRVANVIDALKADVLTIQEGPSRRSEMELFVEKCLEGSYDVAGPAGKGQQKIYALFKKGSVQRMCRLDEDRGFDFDDVWDADIDADMQLDAYRFTRPPLVVEIKTNSGKTFRLISIHTKSKYVHGQRALWNDPVRRPQFIEAALRARRRISAEAMRIREYLDLCLEEDNAARIVVTGDFNDGPGLDYFERRYLTHDVAGIIAGSPFRPRFMLRHAFVDLEQGARNFTAVFDDFVDNVKGRKVLLDHILVSAGLFWDDKCQRNARGRIEHAVFDSQIDSSKPTRSRQHLPSDHRPQSVTFKI